MFLILPTYIYSPFGDHRKRWIRLKVWERRGGGAEKGGCGFVRDFSCWARPQPPPSLSSSSPTREIMFIWQLCTVSTGPVESLYLHSISECVVSIVLSFIFWGSRLVKSCFMKNCLASMPDLFPSPRNKSSVAGMKNQLLVLACCFPSFSVLGIFPGLVLFCFGSEIFMGWKWEAAPPSSLPLFLPPSLLQKRADDLRINVLSEGKQKGLSGPGEIEVEASPQTDEKGLRSHMNGSKCSASGQWLREWDDLGKMAPKGRETFGLRPASPGEDP